MLKYKQFIFGILIGALLFGGLSAIAETPIEAVLSDIKVTLNGTPLKLENPPIMYQDRTYLPVRKIAEAVGKNVDYDEASNTVVISDNAAAVDVDTSEYISLREAAQQCGKAKEGYDIIPNYTDDDIKNTATLVKVSRKGWAYNEVIISGIPFVYIDNQEYIPLEFYSKNVLPLLK